MLRHRGSLGFDRPSRDQETHILSMLQWCSQKIGSRGDTRVLRILPPIQLWTPLCGVASIGPCTPKTRVQLVARLFCPVGREVPNASKPRGAYTRSMAAGATSSAGTAL